MCQCVNVNVVSARFEKQLLLIFCLSLPPLHLVSTEQLPPRGRRIQSILKLWRPSKIAVQKRSILFGAQYFTFSRPAWKQMPRLAVSAAEATAGQAPKRVPSGPATTKQVFVFRPAGFFTFFFIGTAKRWSRNYFSGCGLVFCMP
jgi:hypothetical protein